MSDHDTERIDADAVADAAHVTGELDRPVPLPPLSGVYLDTLGPLDDDPAYD